LAVTPADLVKQFVDKLNGSPPILALPDQVSSAFWTDIVGSYVTWQILPADESESVLELEKLIGHPFSPTFRALVAGFHYPEFEFQGVRLHSNTGEDYPTELRTNLLRDKHLVRPLLTDGLIPFARPAGGSYDVLCFDTRAPAIDGEWRIVIADHEAALIRDRAIVQPFADSFASILQAFIDGPSRRGC